jgi:hypothetical protein
MDTNQIMEVTADESIISYYKKMILTSLRTPKFPREDSRGRNNIASGVQMNRAQGHIN